MSHAVLALGLAAVNVSGCVWYLPALADLRAGADRPVSRRSAAAACVSGWSTSGIVALALLLAEAWWIPCAVAVAGAAATVGLRAGAVVQRRREARESARNWAELGHAGQPPGTARARTGVAVLIGLGPAAAVVALVVVVEPGGGTGGWAVAVLPAAVVGLSLALAVAYLRMTRNANRCHPRPSRSGPRDVRAADTRSAAGPRTRAAVQRRREMWEAARRPGELGHGRPLPVTDRSRYAVGVLIGTGLAAAAITAAVRVAAGPEDAVDWLTAVAAPAAVLGLFLTLAVTHTRVARRRARTDHVRPPC
ncbi:hypothetical protein [Streptomyces shenzhenensis]|uniref:hypothetical protein n=2 Tax=Streptomyces shenzhenensis TaxID=943815 RepID=UPI0036AC0DAE